MDCVLLPSCLLSEVVAKQQLFSFFDDALIAENVPNEQITGPKYEI